LRRRIIRSALDTLYFTGAHRLLGSKLGGIGAILTLHRVRPARNARFHPNRYLEVTPDFLEAALVAIRQEGLEAIGLDEMWSRLRDGRLQRRFVCLTFDDGYRDNREFAYPILKRQSVPFAIYVPTDMPDRRGRLWWLTLEKIVATSSQVEVPAPDGVETLSCRTDSEKNTAIAAIHRILRMLPSDKAVRETVSHMAARAGIDETAEAAESFLSWRELGELAADPLVTIGAHTASHPILSKICDRALRFEMSQSAARIAAEIGTTPEHFAYPFGDRGAAGPREFAAARELGFKTAVTTRPGVLFPEHGGHLWALPRISMNGEMQSLRHLSVLISGVGTALWNGFRRLDVA
jgi:peptidoglycan/xylan/chitin deacetylase (PgdA/CDA1 family)